jgi:hypothetical protein
VNSLSTALLLETINPTVMAQPARGLYRTRGVSGFSNNAKVVIDVLSFHITEAVYRERGCEPRFDTLPWKDQYDAAINSSSVGASQNEEAINK